MNHLKTELHCHNSFSNFHVGKDEAPYDCDITIPEQLERSHAIGLDALFVTNHNTLNGYRQILEYKNDHAKYKMIQILPAEEITTDTGAHVIAYGISKEIKAGLTLEEIIDENKNKTVCPALHIRLVCLMLYETRQRCAI